MFKYTQTIRRQQSTEQNCLSVFDHFVGLAFKGIKTSVDSPTLIISMTPYLKIERNFIITFSEVSCLGYMENDFIIWRSCTKINGSSHGIILDYLVF